MSSEVPPSVDRWLTALENEAKKLREDIATALDELLAPAGGYTMGDIFRQADVVRRNPNAVGPELGELLARAKEGQA